MRTGSRYKFHIPAELAYGKSRGPVAALPLNSTLVFEAGAAGRPRATRDLAAGTTGTRPIGEALSFTGLRQRWHPVRHIAEEVVAAALAQPEMVAGGLPVLLGFFRNQSRMKRSTTTDRCPWRPTCRAGTPGCPAGSTTPAPHRGSRSATAVQWLWSPPKIAAGQAKIRQVRRQQGGEQGVAHRRRVPAQLGGLLLHQALQQVVVHLQAGGGDGAVPAVPPLPAGAPRRAAEVRDAAGRPPPRGGLRR